MIADFIEIGCSDFGTEIEKVKPFQRGISIEAVKNYCDRLPDKDNVIKHHLAISDCHGTCNISHINPEVVERLIRSEDGNGHTWIKGCNRINEEHPMLSTYLNYNHLKREDVMVTETVEKMTLYSVMVMDSVRGVYFLKIDTEGHDVVILKRLLLDVTSIPTLLPHRIQFETNTNIPVKDVEDLLDHLLRIGYTLQYRGEDTIVSLYVPRHGATTFSAPFENYYIAGYPANYDPHNQPHPNTLKGAQTYCKQHTLSGVTLQDGRYEVRSGSMLLPVPEGMVGQGICSWSFV